MGMKLSLLPVLFHLKFLFNFGKNIFKKIKKYFAGYTVMVVIGCCYTMYHNGVKKGDFQWDRRPYWKYTLNDR